MVGHTSVLISLLDIAIFIVTLHVQLNVLTGHALSSARTLLRPRKFDPLNIVFTLDFPKIFLFSVSAGTLGVPCLHVTLSLDDKGLISYTLDSLFNMWHLRLLSLSPLLKSPGFL